MWFPLWCIAFDQRIRLPDFGSRFFHPGAVARGVFSGSRTKFARIGLRFRDDDFVFAVGRSFVSSICIKFDFSGSVRSASREPLLAAVQTVAWSKGAPSYVTVMTQGLNLGRSDGSTGPESQPVQANDNAINANKKPS